MTKVEFKEKRKELFKNNRGEIYKALGYSLSLLIPIVILTAILVGAIAHKALSGTSGIEEASGLLLVGLLIALIALIFFSGWINTTLIVGVDKAIRGEKLTFISVLKESASKILPYIGRTIGITLIIIIPTAILTVPVYIITGEKTLTENIAKFIIGACTIYYTYPITVLGTLGYDYAVLYKHTFIKLEFIASAVIYGLLMMITEGSIISTFVGIALTISLITYYHAQKEIEKECTDDNTAPYKVEI